MYDTIVGVQQKDFHLRIDPLINFGGGYDAANGGKAIWVNTRGVSASGDIGEKEKFPLMLPCAKIRRNIPIIWCHSLNIIRWFRARKSA